MNVQTHMSGQVSGQIPTQMQQQQNGNAIPQQLQSIGNAAVDRSTSTMDNALHRARGLMQEKILAILLKRHRQPINEGQWSKLTEIVKRLEDGLFRFSHNKEEYLNMDTLESRLQNMLRPQTNQSQQYQSIVNSSSSVATMIPSMGHELHRARGFMQEKILAILLMRNQQPINESLMSKFTDIAKRLEEGLFRFSHNKEEYLNMDTLESRLQNLLRRQINQNHQC